MPNQEPAIAWPFGNGPVRVGTQGLFRPCLKTFFAPFNPARLTAPGSPRMLNPKRDQGQKTWRFINGIKKNLKTRFREDIKRKWIAKSTFNRIRTFSFCFELCLRLINFHYFPPFWNRVRNISKCDKLVMITLFGIYLVNKTIKYDE